MKDIPSPSNVTGLDSWSNDWVLSMADPGLVFEDPSNPSLNTTDGTFSAIVDQLDAFAGTNVDVTSMHYMSVDLSVGGAAYGGTQPAFDLTAGDVLLSIDVSATLTSSNSLAVTSDDVFVFRPDAPGDYSAGTFYMLLEAPLGGNQIRAVSVVEQDTVVGDTILHAGDFLLVAGSATYDKSITLFEATDVGAGTTSGTITELIYAQDSGVAFGQKIDAISLVQSDTMIGGRSLSAGTILMSVEGADTVGANNLSVADQDVFALEVTQTSLGAGTGNAQATASLFFEAADANFDDTANKDINAISLVAGNADPTVVSNTFSVDENSANGTAVGSVTGSDPEDGTVNYAITAGNTDGAFAIDATTGQITVANSTVLDFETTPSFTLTVAAIDSEGAYDTATVTINLNDVNDAPVLDNSGDMSLTTITEDQTTNSGNTVAEIIASAGGDRITDQDAGAVEGIAVTGLNSSNGTWQYSINGGSTWLAVGAVSDNSALLLRATDKLRFVPDATECRLGQLHLPRLGPGQRYGRHQGGRQHQWRLRPRSARPPRPLRSPSPRSTTRPGHAGSSRWARPTRTAARPGWCPDFVSGSWDVDAGAQKGLAIVGVDDSNGTWQYTLDGTNWFDIGSVSTNNALLLAADATSAFRFVPDADWNGTTGVLQYKAWDQTSGMAGTYVDASISGGTTAFSGTSGSVLTVNAVNDAPVIDLDPNNTSGGADDGDYTATFTEGDAPVAITAANAILSDVDDTSITGLNININSAVPDGAAERVTIGGHQFTYGNAEYVVVAVGGTSFAIDYDGAESFGVTKDGVGEMPIADAEALLLSLTYENVSQDPTAGERVFDIVVSDGTLGASATSTISVVPVNDAPVITSDGGGATAGLTVLENQTAVTTVTASDVDVGDTLTFSITGGADAGKFSIDPNTGALTFDNAPDYENPGDVGTDNVYEVEVTADDGNGGADVQTLSITIANTGDNTPVANADAYNVDEDGSLAVDWWDS